MYPTGNTSDIAPTAFLANEEDRLQRAAAMMRALQEALDKVYDPESDAQLRKLARDYCDLLPEAPCQRGGVRADCSVTTTTACPLLQLCPLPGVTPGDSDDTDSGNTQ